MSKKLERCASLFRASSAMKNISRNLPSGRRNLHQWKKRCLLSKANNYYIKKSLYPNDPVSSNLLFFYHISQASLVQLVLWFCGYAQLLYWMPRLLFHDEPLFLCECRQSNKPIKQLPIVQWVKELKMNISFCRALLFDILTTYMSRACRTLIFLDHLIYSSSTIVPF